MTKHLSPSRIKTKQSCSWTYWCKYVLKLPDTNNDGARRGSICHGLWEHLGHKRRRKTLQLIRRKKDIFAAPAVERYVKRFMATLGLVEVNDKGEDNIQMIRDMTLAGLEYDFLGHGLGRPTEAHSEIRFKIPVDDGEVKYLIVGIIDKLFLYKTKGVALIRDFKTSRSVFEEAELADNMQDLFYRLAVHKMFPDYKTQNMEFLFARFPTSEGLVETPPVSEGELRGFEYQLTELQKEVENFSLEDAKKNFAARQRFPVKGEGFKGPLLCGFAKRKGQLKKDGSVMWHCPFKFDFDYYDVFNAKNEKVKSYHIDTFDPSCIPEGGRFEKKYYEGCPMHC